MKVCINAGHAPNGMPDPGAVNPLTGDRECDYTKSAMDMLANYLEQAGLEVVTIQDDSLSNIVNYSNECGADIFVSLHCNAFNEVANGTETHYLTNSGRNLASYIHSNIVDSVPLKDRGIKNSNFYVLKMTDAVAVLVEMAFIDNMDDLFILRNDLDKIAAAIARGVTDYLGG